MTNLCEQTKWILITYDGGSPVCQIWTVFALFCFHFISSFPDHRVYFNQIGKKNSNLVSKTSSWIGNKRLVLNRILQECHFSGTEDHWQCLVDLKHDTLVLCFIYPSTCAF